MEQGDSEGCRDEGRRSETSQEVLDGATVWVIVAGRVVRTHIEMCFKVWPVAYFWAAGGGTQLMSSEGITWCRDNPAAIAALRVAAALL